jgi:cell division protein FtsI (penicillin-binding protein 3)
MSIRKDILLRVGLVYVVAVILGLLIIFRVAYLQIAEHDKWSKANTLTMKDIIIEPNRGDICASDGRILASSIPFYEIRMDTKCPGLTDEVFNAGIDSLAYNLSNLFRDKSKAAYKNELVSARYRGERYHLIKRKASYLKLKELKKFPLFRLGRYKGGFIVIQNNRRVQPFVNLASRTIGYLTMGDTVVGIEGAYNDQLKGVRGVRLMQRIAGNVWMPVNSENEVEPKDGMDIITTIDVNIQDVAHNALYRQLKKHGASHGTAVLMEVETGAIKAMTNLKRDSSGRYYEEYNYAIGECTEPGSTFKLASLMVALEDGYIDLDDSIDTDEGIVYYHDHPVRDSKKGGYGKITVKEAFEVSSNVAISKIITEHYSDDEKRFVERIYSMNMNQKLGIEIKGEGNPYIKFPGDPLWSGISLPMMSYGYEIQMTPLQILTFYNAVANDGVMVRPMFVNEIQFHGETVKRFKTKVLNSSICSKATIKKAKLMLEGVVEEGTAKNLKNSNYKIAGKTGTAQIANKKYGYKSKSRVSYQASFAGYFPADNPKYSCIVVVNAPSNYVYYGNLVAGPVFKEIADKVYSTMLEMYDPMSVNEEEYLTEAPYTRAGNKDELGTVLENLEVEIVEENVQTEWISTQKKDSLVALYNRYIHKDLVPNVKGMGLKDAMFLLENSGLKVQVIGKGSVKNQSIQPGSRIRRGTEIVIVMTS